MKNIYLIGMRGSGKTTIAQHLAKMLDRKWVDMDVEIKAHQQKSISEIVEQEGWEAFRKVEQQVVDEVSQLDNHIISTGGGVLMFFENGKKLRESGTLVYLSAEPETLFMRLNGKGDDRPGLKEGTLKNELEEVMKERKETYEEYANITIQTDGKTPEEITTEILEMLP